MKTSTVRSAGNPFRHIIFGAFEDMEGLPWMIFERFGDVEPFEAQAQEVDADLCSNHRANHKSDPKWLTDGP
jgi:hypothetical protein